MLSLQDVQPGLGPLLDPARRRDHLYRAVTRMLAVALLPVAFIVAPGRTRHVACQWAFLSGYGATVRNPALPMDESGVFDDRAALRYRLQ